MPLGATAYDDVEPRHAYGSPIALVLAAVLGPAMHVEPPSEGIEPAGTGRRLVIHAEAMPALLEQMEFNGAPGRTPAVDQAEPVIRKERIIGRERNEQRGASFGTATALSGP